jgi:hypothetical protein
VGPARQNTPLSRYLPEGDEHTNVPCRRRPHRRRCRGDIIAELDRLSGYIVWRCALCGDHGVIHGWQDTLWNRGGTPHPPHRSTIDSEMLTVFHRGLKAYLTQFRHRRRSDLARSPPHPGAGLPPYERATECAGSMSWRSVPSCETRERVLETTAHRHSHSAYISSTCGTNPRRVGLRHRISRRIRDLQVHQRGTQRLAMRVERQ